MTSLTVLFAALHEAHVSHARRTREAEVLQEHQEPVMAEGEDCLKYQQEAHRGARNRVGRVGDEDVVVLLEVDRDDTMKGSKHREGRHLRDHRPVHPPQGRKRVVEVVDDHLAPPPLAPPQTPALPPCRKNKNEAKVWEMML